MNVEGMLIGRLSAQHLFILWVHSKLFIQTTHFDDAALARNERIRNSGILDKAKLQLHQGEDIRGAISCPSVAQWNRFKKDNPEFNGLLNSSLEHERLRAMDMVSLHHPDWVVYTRM